ncbi:malto-oligosyltrehalose trehalohydrolase [Methylobacter sp.]|uniref:malto-oligosyltrehalose trehalohydrolase n=1 Tax=Methylobacter sp. TaxID=2051955 RepID=UPI003DA584A3
MAVKRRHLMPFGAQLLDDGRVRFRLWAPGADKVELSLLGLDPEEHLPMTPEDEGWFGIITEHGSSAYYYQYCINEAVYVPDPASRYQPETVHGASQIVDPNDWDWQDQDWQGRPWEEVVLYEMHIGTFTAEGTFAAARQQFDYLAELGVTALQLMPIADFPGTRNWGYDGVLPFAPATAYGTPNDLKDFIQTAHARGLMVFLDMVYNHFGPEGNYLNQYAPAFFTDRHQTPWGDAVNFDGPGSTWVRNFFVHNALYWLEEYHVDGLRFDSVHAIFDDSDPARPPLFEYLAQEVRHAHGYDRHIHLVLENDNNAAHYLRPTPAKQHNSHYNAQWNDDIHHVLHVLLTGETSGYYQDYAEHTLEHLARCLTEGFAYQGEISSHRDCRPRGEPSADLPPTAFVAFLQNHDQIGNRAFAERLSALCSPKALRAATAIILLAPSIPLLFMGQEWGASTPFPYFVDFTAELSEKVIQGRLREFARFPDFNDSLNIPLPNQIGSFLSAKLDWHELEQPSHRQWLDYHRHLLDLRRQHIQPRLSGMAGGQAEYRLLSERALTVSWRLVDDSQLELIANLGDESVTIDSPSTGEVIFRTDTAMADLQPPYTLPPWSVVWLLAEG